MSDSGGFTYARTPTEDLVSGYYREQLAEIRGALVVLLEFAANSTNTMIECRRVSLRYMIHRIDAVLNPDGGSDAC